MRVAIIIIIIVPVAAVVVVVRAAAEAAPVIVILNNVVMIIISVVAEVAPSRADMQPRARGPRPDMAGVVSAHRHAETENLLTAVIMETHTHIIM